MFITIISIEALIVGGMGLFDKVRNAFECSGIDLEKAYFSRLK